MIREKCTNYFVVVTLLLLCLNTEAVADVMEKYRIGGHGQANVTYPPWFKESFLDLRDDLDDARKAGKRGVIVFLSQKNCNHCQAFIDTTLSDPGILGRVQKNYDVIALDIFNDVEFTDIDGSVSSVKDFADKQRARLTPTLLFYGVEGIRLVKIIGFYPPEKFTQVLDYIDDDLYQSETISEYLKKYRKEADESLGEIDPDFTMFTRPPYMLDRTHFRGQQPLLVVFETPACTPCRRFHEGVLNDPAVRQLMPEFEAIQLNTLDNTTNIMIPTGRYLTPRQWSEELQLAYDISIVFFDVDGREVHRLDAETGRDRMSGSMQYVLEKAYLRHEQFLQWRKENAIKRKRTQRSGL
ncbi:MAG: thioredoxin fold domain-containing protein [Thiohalomonadales bacterium]|nr:thioredoxin fold domain-containing protein [Thiohalomonadales bacterium]